MTPSVGTPIVDSDDGSRAGYAEMQKDPLSNICCKEVCAHLLEIICRRSGVVESGTAEVTALGQPGYHWR